MKTLLSTVPLMNRLSGKFEDAHLFCGIDTNNLAHIEGRWRPVFDKRMQEAAAAGETLSEINAEDQHWQWSKKMIAAEADPFIFGVFALECAGSTQAIMLVRKGGENCFSRHTEHPRAPIIYVDLISTAPWNRPKLVSEPIYKGCGRILISTAISLSFEEEMQGRIGLHSLPGAEMFYETQIGMSNFGKDNNYEGLRYFELPSSNAAQFFSNPS